MIDPTEPSPVSEQLAWVRAQEERTHRQRRLTNWIVVVACLATFSIVTFDHVDLASRVNNLTGIVNGVTNKKAQQAAAAATARNVDLIIVCEENHDDRARAVLQHRRVPPLAAGCPKDTIGR